ncbi:MAG: outer membrane protein OmpK [Bacilli bacterium]
MKKFLAVVGIALASVSLSANAGYSFGNISVNKVDWSDGTSQRGGHLKDFDFIELEGGAGNEFGDIYGFVDFENFASYGKVEDMQVSMKGVTTLNTKVENLAVYHQTFAFLSKDFKATDTVLGLSYQMRHESFSFRPFIGVQLSTHNADFNTERFSGLNGGMMGWTAMYDFNIGEEKFQITNWNELTFARNADYLKLSGDAKEFGVNGAVAAWWHISPRVSTGVQYRYADNRLGTNGRANGVIYTAKFNF